MKTKNHKPEKVHEYNKKENGKNNTGCPTKYKPEYCQDIINFFLSFPKTKQRIKSVTYTKSGEKREDYEEVGADLPTISKYALKINVNLDTIYEWEKVYKDFSESLSKCRMIYKDFLNDNALQEFYNPLYTKFVAINTTDMRDKQEVEHSGEIAIPVIKVNKSYGK